MSIISQDTWDNMPKKEKDWIIKEYNSDAGEGHSMLSKLFGKENLKPQPQIKTWEDLSNQGLYVGINSNEDFGRVDLFANNVDLKIQNKILATIKIAKLIELGYGGMITQEEWKDTGIRKYCIFESEGNIFYQGFNCFDAHFIAFRTPKQRKEFMSYPENVELVKQYYMI